MERGEDLESGGKQWSGGKDGRVEKNLMLCRVSWTIQKKIQNYLLILFLFIYWN